MQFSTSSSQGRLEQSGPLAPQAQFTQHNQVALDSRYHSDARENSFKPYILTSKATQLHEINIPPSPISPSQIFSSCPFHPQIRNCIPGTSSLCRLQCLSRMFHLSVFFPQIARPAEDRSSYFMLWEGRKGSCGQKQIGSTGRCGGVILA